MNHPELDPVLPGLSPQRIEARRRALLSAIQEHQTDLADRRWCIMPRSRALLLTAAVPAAALVALLVVVAMGLNRPAYASWTADPVKPASAAVASLQRTCADRLHELEQRAGHGAPSDLAVAEQRGKISTVVLVGPTSYGYRVTGPRQLLAGVEDAAALPPQRRLMVVNTPQLSGRDGQATLIAGRVAPDVARVDIETSDGRTMRASVGGGWFLAWWPSKASVRTVTALDTAGHPVDTANPPDLPPGPPSPTHH